MTTYTKKLGKYHRILCPHFPNNRSLQNSKFIHTQKGFLRLQKDPQFPVNKPKYNYDASSPNPTKLIITNATTANTNLILATTSGLLILHDNLN